MDFEITIIYIFKGENHIVENFTRYLESIKKNQMEI